MTALDTVITLPVVERIGWTLLHFFWQGITLAIVMGLALLCLRRRSSNTRYLVACMGLVAMSVAPAVTFMMIPTQEIVIDTPPPSVVNDPSPMSNALPVIVSDGTAALAEVQEATFPSEKAAPIASSSTWHERLCDDLLPYLPWITAVWILGVFVLSGRLVVGWVSVQRLKHLHVRPVSLEIDEKLAWLCDRLRVHVSVRLLESTMAKAPMAIGWFRPVILVPTVALTGLTPEQLRAVLAHELAHIRRYDYLVNLIQSVIETLLFYHPAIWWLSHRIRIERENCCDDIAVSVAKDRIGYARALANLAELRVGTGRLAVAADGGSLLARIRRIMGVANPSSHLSRCAAGTLILLGAVALAVVFQVTSLDAAADEKSATAKVESEAEAQTDGPKVADVPHRWRHFVTLVAGQKEITFQGQKTDWENVSSLLGKVRDRDKTVLCVALESDEIPEAFANDVFARAGKLVKEFGFEYLSRIGVHPLGTRGGESQYIPPLTERGRWRHVVPVVTDGLGWNVNHDYFTNVDPKTLKKVRNPLASVPQRSFSVIRVSAIPNSPAAKELREISKRIERFADELGFESVEDAGITEWAGDVKESQFIPDDKQPGRWRHFVCLVFGAADEMTFQGEPVTWDDLPRKLESLPDRAQTVLELADSIPHEDEAIWQRIRGHGLDQLGFDYLSHIGLHPLGSKGGPSIFMPKVPASEPSRQPVAQQPASTSPSADAEAKAPKFRCDEDHYDFGTVWSGDEVKASFVIRNDGDTPLEITNVKPSCGCTQVEEFDRIISASGQTTMAFKLSTRGMQGKVTKSVRISCNDPTVSQPIKLYIKGTIKARIALEPRNGAYFGTVKAKDDLVKTVTLTNNTDKPMKLQLKVQPKPGPPESIFSYELKEIEPGRKAELTVKANGPFETHANSLRITLLTGIPEEPEITVPCYLYAKAVTRNRPEDPLAAAPPSTRPTGDVRSAMPTYRITPLTEMARLMGISNPRDCDLIRIAGHQEALIRFQRLSEAAATAEVEKLKRKAVYEGQIERMLDRIDADPGFQVWSEQDEELRAIRAEIATWQQTLEGMTTTQSSRERQEAYAAGNKELQKLRERYDQLLQEKKKAFCKPQLQDVDQPYHEAIRVHMALREQVIDAMGFLSSSEDELRQEARRQALKQAQENRKTAGVVYISGEVNRPGVYKLSGDGLTCLRLLAAAGGVDQLAAPKSVTLTRRISWGREESSTWYLQDLRDGKVEDFELHANDQLRVGK